MMEFSQLTIVNKVEEEIPSIHHKRYVIGAIPDEQLGVLSNINVFVIYDKCVMRVVVRVKTKKDFPSFVEWITKKSKYSELGYTKREIVISKKFIQSNGRATNPAQISRTTRTNNSIRS